MLEPQRSGLSSQRPQALQPQTATAQPENAAFGLPGLRQHQRVRASREGGGSGLCGTSQVAVLGRLYTGFCT